MTVTDQPLPNSQQKSGGSRGRVNATMVPLLTMGRRYDKLRHGDYVAYLKTAVTQKPPARNVAVTGAYGTGKSSVLAGLKSALKSESKWDVLEISLTSLGDAPDAKTAIKGEVAASAPDVPVQATLDHRRTETSLTVALQKEIVKRLLYSVRPRTLPRSRFSRIRGVRWWAATGISIVLGSVLTYIAFVLDLPTPFGLAAERWLGTDWQWIAWPAVFLAVVVLAYLTQMSLSGFRLREVSVGAASLSLGDGVDNYFDMYIEEIVYFFQRTKKRVVIFEDIDRFNDPGIFQELRELNQLLNASPQLRAPVTFIYSLRDSLFDEIAGTGAANSHRTGVDTPASDRAKFFDLVVPLVPFISHEVASDLLLEVMQDVPEKERPNSRLLAMAGKHFTDMRVLISIRNEYVIFARGLLAKTQIEGLTKEGLFAMVLYKHMHLSDTESIRTGHSFLDKLTTQLGDDTLKRVAWLDEKIATLQSDQDGQKTVDARSSQAGQRLLNRVTAAANIVGRSGSVAEVQFGGLGFDAENIKTPVFWRSISSETPKTLLISMSTGHQFNFSLQNLAALLEADFPANSWLVEANQRDQDELSAARITRTKLLASSWSTKMTDPTLSGPGSGGSNVDFSETAQAIVGDGLVYELIKAGHLDRNFQLYTTSYYGSLLSATARSFILQSVDRNVSLPLFKLDESKDIEAILETQGLDFIASPSGLNVHMFNYLLKDQRIDPALRLLAQGPVDLTEPFVETYLTTGSDPHALVGRLAPSWPRIFNLLNESARLSDEQRLSYVDTALQSLGNQVDYQVSDESKKMLEANLGAFSAFVRRLTGGQAVALSSFMEAKGLKLKSFSGVDAGTVRELARRERFEVTGENLSAIVPSGSGIGLDTLLDVEPAAAAYVLREWERYILAIDSAPTPSQALDDPSRLRALLELASGTPKKGLDALLARTPKSAVLENLADWPDSSVFPALARARKFKHSAANVAHYLEQVGSLDALFARYLDKTHALVDVEKITMKERFAIAESIINSPQLSVTAKTRLAKSLALESGLDVNLLKLSEPDLFSALIKSQLVDDTAATFVGVGTASWVLKEAGIAVSAHFPTFALDVGLSPDELHALVMSRKISAAVKVALIERFTQFLQHAETPGVKALLNYARIHGFQLTAGQLIAASSPTTQEQVAGYIGRSGSHLSDSEVIQALRSLSGQFQDLISKSGARPKFNNFPGLAELLGRLRSMGLIGIDKTLRNGEILVFALGGR